MWLSGFGFSSPYRGFKLSIWYYAGFVLTRFGTNPVLYSRLKVQNLSWYKTGFVTCRTKTGFSPTLNQPLQNRLCACSKNRRCACSKTRLCDCSKIGFVPTLNQRHLNRLCACSKTGFVSSLNLPHQDRLCADPKPAFSFWINILTISEVMCDCQGLGLVARIEASNLVFNTMQVLYWPVLRQIQFCSFDRRCKTYLDIKTGFVSRHVFLA